MGSPQVLGSCWLGQRQAEEEEGGPGSWDVMAGFSPFIIYCSLIALLPIVEHPEQVALTPLTMPRAGTCPVTD